jgi:hypothetical protein
VSPGAIVLAAAIPILFLHVRYQPGLQVALGSTTLDAYLSDFAVLAVVVTALFEVRRRGLAPLAAGRALWVAGTLFLAWMFVGVAYGHVHAASYPWQTHLVTAAKFAEYALLAPALPLLLRGFRDLLWPIWSVALWSAAATAVGVAQFFGAGIFLSGTVARRQASFLSSADFAALSAAALLVGVVAVVAPQVRGARVPAAIATVGGALGMIVAGAVASVLGLGTALAVLLAALVLRGELVLRRVVLVGAVSAVVLLGVVAIRGSDLDAFARFLGASPGTASAPAAKVQTYAHRTLLAWLGFEIWKDNPVAGVGWEASGEPATFEPYLPAAHRRFPDESPLAFPSAAPGRQYGVQNSWIQALADLGVVGFALWVSVFGAAAWTAARGLGSVTALYGLAATALLAWLWAAQGFVAGIPLDALTFLVFGVAATRLVHE